MGLGDIGPEDSDLEGTEPEYPEEDAVEEMVVNHFQEKFPEVHGDDDHQMDIPDVIAVGEKITWGVEVKGDAKSKKQRIYSALGQVVYDMSAEELKSDEVKWGIAFPESIDSREQYRERIDGNVSREILEMLDLHVLFVEESGDVDVVAPGDIGTKE